MNLTPRQEQAVKAAHGHYVVLAGPGCGKTHLITEKVIYLFKREVIPDPFGLLAVTFTDGAARIMKARLRLKGFDQWERIFVGTFHSFGCYLLRGYGSDIGVREDYEVLDPADQLSILQDLRRRYVRQYRADELKNLFEGFKRRGIYPDHLGPSYSQRLRTAFQEYQTTLEKQNKIDFADMVFFGSRLLRKSSLARRLYTNFFRYIIVDEFQDTDRQQLDMIHILSKPAIGSTVVGDDDQSIFGWRGALRENVYRIRELLGSKEIIVGQNFRSDEAIVEAAQQVIGFDPDRREKAIVPVSSERGYLHWCKFEDPAIEAKQVATWIKSILERAMVPDPGEIAVITRVHYRAEEIVQELMRNSIPWFDPSRLHFQESWETSLALAAIELAHDPNSSLFLHRVLSVIEEAGFAVSLGMEDALEVALIIRDKLRGIRISEIDAGMLPDILEIASINEIVKKASAGISDSKRRLENLKYLLRDISSEVEEHDIGVLDAINRFMGYGAIQVISGHQSKGREFDIIFFLGLEDDLVPFWKSHSESSDLAEERRIFYVGLTRARKRVILTSVSWRNTSLGRKETFPSRFLRQIPGHYFSEISL